ncbi:MAG: hypothetical protein IPH84_16535 [Bacteroidales bacterium]|nr:hypothetical protein [Bacteroidales bacterium]
MPLLKAFIEFLGGKIWVKSTPVKDLLSIFIFLIFHWKLLQTKSSDHADEDFSSITLLVAEDDDINYVYMERLLSKTNARLIRAQWSGSCGSMQKHSKGGPDPHGY